MTATLLLAAEALDAALRGENAALVALDHAAAAAFGPAKQAAAAAFAAAHAEAAAGGLDAAARAALSALAPHLADRAAENRRLLARGIAVQGRLIELVARAATGAPPDAAGYGAAGRPAVRRSAPPRALSARA